MALEHLASPLATGPYIRPVKLNVFIIDVSGSMGWSMQRLAQDTAGRIRLLPQHDAVLIGIFSSPGFYRWIAARVLDSADEYDAVCANVTRELFARNTTCFSEILTDTPKAIAPFLVGYRVVTLTFMSDGCAVVPDLKLEYTAVDAATQALKPLLTSGVVVAYGDYADRKLLARMAQNMGIEFLSTDALGAIGEAFSQQSDSAAQYRRNVAVPDTSKLTFATEPDGSVTVVEPDDGTALVSNTAHVYSVPSTGPAASWVPQTPHDLVYSAALAYVRQNKVDDALELLSTIGDVAIVRALSHALTNAELATVEGLLQGAVLVEEERFLDGREPGCLPKADAFDLLDLLTLLMDDKDCKFYPRHPAFRYKRIGRTAKQKEGYPTFSPSDEIGVSFAGLVGNKAELNLSVLVSIPGVLLLPETLENGQVRPSSLANPFPTSIWRTYSLIANALPVVTQLPVTLSEAAFRTLCQERVIRHRQKYDPARVEVLDLSRVPVCNKARGLQASDWDRMATLSLTSVRLGAWIKVFKAKADEFDPEKAGKRPVVWSNEEAAYLAACGVGTDGSFHPQVEVEPATDVLHIRTFEVRPQHDSAVSMKDFASMWDGKKKWNYVGQLMRDARGFMEQHIGSTTQAHHLSRSVTDALGWLAGEIATLTREKRQIDMELHTRRFAVALTGTWPQHFPTETTEITSAGHPVVLTFTHTEKKI